MGIEQIQSAKTKALPPSFQFNWSQMESIIKMVADYHFAASAARCLLSMISYTFRRFVT
jgi:hypothetical protein